LNPLGSLGTLGVSGTLDDPNIELFAGTGKSRQQAQVLGL
jgi:hypothetical protein